MKIPEIVNYNNLSDDSVILNMDREQLIEELSKTRDLCLFLEKGFENLPDGCILIDEKGHILRVNSAWEKLLGISRENYEGTLVTEISRDIISESCAAKTLITKKPNTIEQVLPNTNRAIYVTSNPVLDSNDNLEMIVGINRDFTEIAETRMRLEKAERQVLTYQFKAESNMQNASYYGYLVANNKKMQTVLYNARKVAGFDTSVLITGDTGTGKEEVAKLIHRNSKRSDGPFVTINCGAIAESLIESELFGYEKGAFTGANASGKVGLFEVADQGTLFLDEVGELSLGMQVKLLRAIQEQSLTRVGGISPVKVNVRIIAATNRDLEKMVAEGQFREDLFYRLNVVNIRLPRLIERREDIIPLAKVFLDAFNKKYSRTCKFTSSAYIALLKYRWPGNVRELKNVVEQALVMAEDDMIAEEDIVFYGGREHDIPAVDPETDSQEAESVRFKDAVEDFEKQCILAAFNSYGSVRKAAQALGMSASTYARRLKKYKPKEK